MKSDNLALLLILGLCMPILLYAQPAASPGAGYEWINTGSSSYTVSGTTAEATFGESGDTDPTDCSSYCSSNCDGDGLLEKLVFGSTSLLASSCEQRAINLSHWNNPNPESGVSPGATSGTVNLATTAQIEIVSAGTKITGSDNKGFIIGGNGSGNFSEFDTQVDYSLDWHVDDYTLDGGTGTQTQQFTWNWGEPGNGTEVEMSGWNGYSTAAFEATGGEVLLVPLGSLIETGGNMEVLFAGEMEMFLTRNYGNADGKVQTVPSLAGEATYTITYDIWEIQTTLPVRLTSFEGSYKEGKTHLLWTTASEINNDRFLIERSSDKLRVWANLGTIKSAGDSYSNTDYSFIDEQPSSGQNYYRLRQVDNDGSETFSDVIHIADQLIASAYTLFPNPFRDQLRLSSEASDSGTVAIINQNGMVVSRSLIQQEIDTRDLSPGLYSITVQDKDGTLRWSNRFVKL